MPGVGISLAADPALRGFTVASGHVPESAGQVAVDKATAADEHFRLGQTVRVVDHAGRVRSFRLVGTIDLGVNHEFGNSTVTVFQNATGFGVTGRPSYDQVVARAAPGVSQAALTATIAALPGMSRYQVRTGAELATAEADAAAHFTQQFTTAILVFAIIALVVACIVICNTFTILVTQRGRELALQRCVGATRRQVFGEMLLEALVVGATASAPVAALGSQHEQPDSARIGWRRAAVAAVFALAGVLVSYAGMHNVSGRAGFGEIAAGGCLCFVAVLALGPVIVPPVITFLGWLPGRLAGATVRLAAANARRNPHRVAASSCRRG